jgi:Retroviral aspartyl protease
MVVMVANGDRMVTDSKCEALHFSIQGNEFSHDLSLLPVTGYDVILGLDWLSKFGPMKVDWQNRWVELNQNGTTVKLQVPLVSAALHQCEAVELSAEWKPQQEILVAQIWLCEADPAPAKLVPADLADIIQQYSTVFKNQTQLPLLEVLITQFP